MVPKVAGKGRSFKGAGLYYLHDKGALTTGRVAFTHTENLPTRNPETAIKCMAYTAANQNQIKISAGGSVKGRKLASPVYAYSLSWSPEEQPTPEEMLKAARETLEALGLTGHETLFVSHNDEPHPHLHVIVNRVHPETGIAAPLSNDRLKLSEWAEAYEKRHGKILCQQRVENNERRRRTKEYVKDRASQSQAEFHQWRKARLTEVFARDQKARDDLGSLQKVERETLIAQKEQAIAALRPAFKKQNSYRWSALYQAQNAETRQLKERQASAWGRLKQFLSVHARAIFRRDQDRTGFLKGAFNTLVSGEEERRKLIDTHEQQRRALADKLNDLRRAEIRTINAEHHKKLDMLKEAQRFRRDQLRDRQTTENQQRAREIKQLKDYEEWREQQARKKLAEARDNAADVTRRQTDPAADFKRAAGAPVPPPRSKADEIRENKEDITGRKPGPSREFNKAAGAPPAPERQDEARDETKEGAREDKSGDDREEAARRRHGQFRENKGDIAGPKPQPARDFGKAAGKPPAPERTESEEQDERRKGRYSAFRDLAKEVSHDRGRDRSKEIKPPGGRGPKGPKI